MWERGGVREGGGSHKGSARAPVGTSGCAHRVGVFRRKLRALVVVGHQGNVLLVDEWDTCPPAHRCCFCPSASLPRRRRRCSAQKSFPARFLRPLVSSAAWAGHLSPFDVCYGPISYDTSVRRRIPLTLSFSNRPARQYDSSRTPGGKGASDGQSR